MRDSSKVIMGATLVMVVSLAIVLGLVLVLLVELYCSILLRRGRRQQLPNDTVDTASPYPAIRAHDHQDRSPSPLSSFYAQGVLAAPGSFLFPAVSSKANDAEMNKDQSLKLHSVVGLQTLDHHHMGIISPPSPISAPLIISSPQPVQEIPVQVGGSAAAVGGGGGGEHFVYISNPIYDNDASRLVSTVDTPFETPDTSPSRLEIDGSSSGEDGDEKAQQSSPATPPLTPMKKLPAEACSVSLRDARSLGTSASDSLSNNGLSSSSSGSPRTSPSW